MLGGQSPVEIDVPVDALTRPRSWGECLREGWGDHDATGPCPWVSCRHHLAWAFAIYGSAGPGSEAAVAEVEKVDLDAMPETCALRVATFGLQRAVGANEADEGRSSEQEDGEDTAPVRGLSINHSHHLTLNEVGVVLGVTRERVRQIESKALAQLLQPSRRGQLPEIEREISRPDLREDRTPVGATTLNKQITASLLRSDPAYVAEYSANPARHRRGTRNSSGTEPALPEIPSTLERRSTPPVRVLTGAEREARIAELNARATRKHRPVITAFDPMQTRERAVETEPTPTPTPEEQHMSDEQRLPPAAEEPESVAEPTAEPTIEPTAEPTAEPARSFSTPCAQQGCEGLVLAHRTGPKPRAEDAPYCLRCRKKRRNKREKAQREAEQRAREQRRKEREERRAAREPYASPTLPAAALAPTSPPATPPVPLFAQIEQLIASEVARRLEAHPDVLFARKIRAAGGSEVNGYIVETFKDAPMQPRAWFQRLEDARDYAREHFGDDGLVTAAERHPFPLTLGAEARTPLHMQGVKRALREEDTFADVSDPLVSLKAVGS